MSVWREACSPGQPPKFTSPDQMWERATEYFAWVEDNPFLEERLAQSNGVPSHEEVKKMRAMTQSGLCIFLNISTSCFDDYSNKEKYLGVTKRIKEIIRDQKFSGAASGFFNANIIARDLGLKDTQETQHTGKNGGPIEWNLQPVKSGDSTDR